jgi:hypothetical protein
MPMDDYEKSFRKILRDLEKAILKIEFYKVGTHDYRVAYGTRNGDIVQAYGYHWQASGKSPTQIEEDLANDIFKGQLRYYDLQRGGWRSLRYDHSIAINHYSPSWCELPENTTLTG